MRARHGVLQIHAKWNDQRHDVIWDSEEVDYFWILAEAKARYAERRAALALMGLSTRIWTGNDGKVILGESG